MELLFKSLKTQNGMSVLLLKRPEKYTVGFSLLLNAGSIYENKQTSGASHFFEHLFFTGTKSYSEEMLRKRQQEIGINPYARTWSDRIEMDGNFPVDEIENSLKLLKEMVFESLITPQALEKERGIIFEEQKLRHDDSYTKLWDEAIKLRFKENNPLGFPIDGTPSSIKNITQKQLLKFYKTHCAPSNSTLILGSNIPFNRLSSLVSQVFGDLNSADKIKNPTFSNKDMRGKLFKALKKDLKRVYFLISFPSYSGGDLYISWKYGFLFALLYETLNKKLRIENGLVYDLSCSSYRLYKSASVCYIQTACDPQNFQNVFAFCIEKIKEIKRGILDIETFERIRSTGNKTLPMNFDSLLGAMAWVADSFYRDQKIHSPKQVIAARNKVTKEDLIKAAHVFDFKKIQVVTLGPTSQKELEGIVKRSVQN